MQSVVQMEEQSLTFLSLQMDFTSIIRPLPGSKRYLGARTLKACLVHTKNGKYSMQKCGEVIFHTEIIIEYIF